MYRTPLKVLWLPILVLVAIGCSSQLQMVKQDETGYLLKLRQEYFAAHPDGEFNEHIRNGEVVKGMDYLAVLVSWGHPDRRAIQTDVTERWTYKELDEDSKDWIEYEFTFRNDLLTDWSLARHFAAGGRLELERDRSALTRADVPKGKQLPPDY